MKMKNDFVELNVILIGFNRPDKFEAVLKKTLICGISNIWISIDGPRNDNDLDPVNIKDIKNLILNYEKKFNIQFKKNFEDSNLGCKKNVIKSVSAVLEVSEHCIILEDDCVPSINFFRFCNELIKKENDSIFGVSGNNFSKSNDKAPFLSQYPHIWGWMVYRKHWSSFINFMSKINYLSFSELVKKKFLFPSERIYWYLVYRNLKKGNLNESWDYPLLFFLWYKGLHFITPHKNLVSNIGLDNSGVHAHIENKCLAYNFEISSSSFRKLGKLSIYRDFKTFLNHYRGWKYTFPINIFFFVKFFLRKII